MESTTSPTDVAGFIMHCANSNSGSDVNDSNDGKIKSSRHVENPHLKFSRYQNLRGKVLKLPMHNKNGDEFEGNDAAAAATGGKKRKCSSLVDKKLYKKHIHQTGDRVYAAWMEEEPFPWYEGVIKSSFLVGKSKFGPIMKYRVLYDDGDVADVPEAFVYASKAEADLEAEFETEGPKGGISRKTFHCKADPYAEKRGWFVSNLISGKAFALLSKVHEEHNAAIVRDKHQGHRNDSDSDSLGLDDDNSNCGEMITTSGNEGHNNDSNDESLGLEDDNSNSQSTPISDRNLSWENKYEHEHDREDGLVDTDDEYPTTLRSNTIAKKKPSDDESSDDSLGLDGDCTNTLGAEDEDNESDDGSRFSESPGIEIGDPDDMSSGEELDEENAILHEQLSNNGAAVPKKRFKMPDSAIKNRVITTVERKEDQLDYFRLAFGDRILVTDTPTPPEVVLERRGIIFQIVYSDLRVKEGQNQTQDNMGPQHYRNYYIADSDSRNSELDIGKELLSIGAFDKIVYNDGPEKARSRLELLASTCRFEKRNNGGGYYYMHRLCKRKFQKIKENNHEGCGFIPRSILRNLLGGLTKACNADAIQVRFMSPSCFGIGKGMLVVKDNITKIQLPPSMVKVGRSENPMHDDVVLVVKQSFPCTKSNILGRLFDDRQKNPTPNQLRTLKPVPIDVRMLLQDKGVPEDLLNCYDHDFKKEGRFCHASLIGVIDATGFLPKGTIFLPGMFQYTPTKVFITRSSCADPSDGLVVNVASLGDMPISAREYFQKFSFGMVVFPCNDDDPLPPKLAGGDIDGDWYFVCWDDEIISHIKEEDDVCDPNHLLLSDDLVGTDFIHKMPAASGKPKEYDSRVIQKIQEQPDLYRVATGPKMKKIVILTKEEIMYNRNTILRVLDHRMQGNPSSKNVDLCIEWESGVIEWDSVGEICSMYSESGPPDVVVNYVLQESLIKLDCCKQISDYLKEKATLLDIVGHEEVENGGVDLICRYEHITHDVVVPFEEIQASTKAKVCLAKYADNNKLFSQSGWNTMNNSWLEAIQDLIEDSVSTKTSQLVTQLHAKFMKSRMDKGVTHHDTLTWGRAKQDAICIKKHGGKVGLPLHLYAELSEAMKNHIEIL